MAFSVEELKSNLSGGGARPALFDVQVTNPIDASGDTKLKFTVKTSLLPSSTLGIIEVPYFGRKVKLAGDRTFVEWTVTIINDEDFLVRNALEKWSSAINSHEGNERVGGTSSSPNSYKSRAQVHQYAKSGRNVKTYLFEGLYPSEVGQIDVSWETVDTIEEYTVTFQYDYWTSDNVFV